MSCGSTTSIPTGTANPASDGAFVHQGAERLVGWIEAVGAMFRRRRQRRILLELEDHLLADIGVTREQAEREARKPLWR